MVNTIDSQSIDEEFEPPTGYQIMKLKDLTESQAIEIARLAYDTSSDESLIQEDKGFAFKHYPVNPAWYEDGYEHTVINFNADNPLLKWLDNKKMSKRVILQLEYDMGDYTSEFDETGSIRTDPEDWEESFQQTDVLVCDMKIVGVKIIDE